jgi:hypothetical protein
LIQPGEHEVNMGRAVEVSLSTNAFFSRDRSSVPSSMMVRSAVKSVSNTESKPIAFKEATIFPVTRCPAFNPKRSPSATRTAGAV